MTIPSHAPVLRNSVVEALWERRVSLLAWVGSTALLAGFLISLVKPMTDLINSTAAFRRYFAAFGPAGADPTFIQAIWFGLAGPVICIFVVIEVGRWTADDDEGRLEMLLSAPFARWRVVAERFVAVAIELLVLVAASCAVAAALASAAGLRFDGGGYVRASALLLPLGLAFGGIGALLSSVAPRLTVPSLGLLATLSYLMLELGPMLDWPDAVNRLSIFKLYGNPLTEGVDWPGLWAMAAIIAVSFIAATVLMQRREVGR